MHIMKPSTTLLTVKTKSYCITGVILLVALAAAGEPCCAYAVARRAGFLLEQGRVKLHEAKRWGVVTNEKCAGQGVLWVLTEDGERELRRVQVAMRDGVDPDAVPVKKVRKPRKKSRGDE